MNSKPAKPTNQPPLNPDALEAAAKALLAVQQPEVSAEYAWNVQFEDGRDELRNEARAAVTAYLAVAHPVVNSDKASAWDEGFKAGWEEAKDPGAFVNDVWDSETPNPYRPEVKS
ncbi:hypothetical protein CQ010_01290 [Arthrobacter sp. MYb211]|uniref:hypothetical protein n=1 Tax=unclassified Arthrobacter TaxID=235627 RepID=UPI000CFD28C2|nr:MULTISPECIES: hypothetical protein [unclassified Arthrobacter]PRA13308.1 hypothetical protein CQ015_03545 [Arthrobacter sp. MYb221]PRC10505.1 hypothetical protein CQ010_01290 [Arthrobacter sp. MYb211]